MKDLAGVHIEVAIAEKESAQHFIRRRIREVRTISYEVSRQRAVRLMNSSHQHGASMLCMSVNLNCPISGTKIATPIKSSLCEHVQCYDLGAFLELAHRSDSWTCPICNKPSRFEDLCIDGLIDAVLRQSGSANEALVFPDGSWRIKDTGKTEKEDIIELSDSDDEEDALISEKLSENVDKLPQPTTDRKSVV